MPNEKQMSGEDRPMTSPNNTELASSLRRGAALMDDVGDWPWVADEIRRAADALDAAEKMRQANAEAAAILRDTVENLSAEEGYSLMRITKAIEALEPSGNSGGLKMVPSIPAAGPAWPEIPANPQGGAK